MKGQKKNNQYTLHVKIDDANQVFSSYNYNEDILNDELGNFLQEKAEHECAIPLKENYIINIHTQNPHLRLPEITRGIHHHFHNRYDAEKRKLRDNTRFALILFAIAITSLLIYYFFENCFHNFFISKICDLVTWVFGWGAVEVSILERHSIRRRCIILRGLAFANVKIISNTKLDAPVYI